LQMAQQSFAVARRGLTPMHGLRVVK